MLRNSVESSLGPFIVLNRVSYSSVALIAHHDQGGFQKEEFIWDCSSGGRIFNRQGGMSIRDQKRKLRDHGFQSQQAERRLEMISTQLHLQ